MNSISGPSLEIGGGAESSNSNQVLGKALPSPNLVVSLGEMRTVTGPVLEDGHPDSIEKAVKAGWPGTAGALKGQDSG